MTATLALAVSAALLGASAESASLVVHPPQIALETSADHQRFVVIRTDADGLSHDVTTSATVTLEDAVIASCADGVLAPRADGTTALLVRFGDAEVRVPVTVSGAAAPRPVTFRRDVVPALTAAGCNTGSCHGSARGQDGFHLSLFGYDPEGDWHRITRELPGRRIDRAHPGASLLLEKGTNAVPHTGGRRFAPGDAEHDTLRAWIAAGAPNDPLDIPVVEAVELFPPEAVIAGADRTLRLVVRAHYSDGTDRDVTHLSVLRTSNERSVRLDGGALVAGVPGEAFVSASFETFTVGSPFIVLPEDPDPEWHDPADSATGAAGNGSVPATELDELVAERLRKLRLRPAELCSDEVFVRRAYLDITGLLPTLEERDAFLADADPQRRRRLVEALVERRSFADQWVMQWAELLQIRSNIQISPKAALLYFEWLRDAIAGGTPIDAVVRSILTATGGTFTEPATNFYENQTETIVLAENVAQAFLGLRIQCAQCHNHPFDRWTQDDYYGFAAFFPQLGRKGSEDPRERIVFDRRQGEVNHPVDGRVVAPKFLGGAAPDTKGRDRRAVFAEWLTAPDNPWFARSIANRVWAHFMGTGIVEPVDDFRVSNPPSNGPLLDELARRLVASGYDLKALVVDICMSRAYQRSTTPAPGAEDDTRNFAYAQLRRLRAETLLDAICQVTEVPEKHAGLPLGARAVEIADGTTSNYFMTTFGRAKRDTVCAAEVVRDPSLSQALHLLNGDTVHAKVAASPVTARLADGDAEPAAVADELFMRCLGRPATEAERAAVANAFAEADRRVAVEDAFWAILNGREFLFNH